MSKFLTAVTLLLAVSLNVSAELSRAERAHLANYGSLPASTSGAKETTNVTGQSSPNSTSAITGSANMKPGDYLTTENSVDISLKVARHLSKKFSYMLIQEKPIEPLGAVIVTSINLDSSGNLIDTGIVRGSAFASKFDSKSMSMVREAAPFPVPEGFKGGRFTVIFLFEHGGNFKMDLLNR